MSPEKHKTRSYCFGGRKCSSTMSVEGDLAKAGRKLLDGEDAYCFGKKVKDC